MYSAYVLDKKSRSKLLKAYPPKFPEVVAHHITHRFPDQKKPPKARVVEVIGHIYNDKIQAVIVAINGNRFRPDGGTYHITISLDRNKGAKPVHSNNLIASSAIEHPTENILLKVKEEVLK